MSRMGRMKVGDTVRAKPGRFTRPFPNGGNIGVVSAVDHYGSAFRCEGDPGLRYNRDPFNYELVTPKDARIKDARIKVGDTVRPTEVRRKPGYHMDFPDRGAESGVVEAVHPEGTTFRCVGDKPPRGMYRETANYEVVPPVEDEWGPGACLAWENLPKPDVTITLPHDVAQRLAAGDNGPGSPTMWDDLLTVVDQLRAVLAEPEPDECRGGGRQPVPGIGSCPVCGRDDVKVTVSGALRGHLYPELPS